MVKKRIIFRGVLIGLGLFNFSLYGEENIPGRIISLGPTITEEIYLLGVQERLVGNTTYCRKPPEAEMKEKVGTITEINIEKIVSLRPDIVLATSLTNAKAKGKLKELGINVTEFSYAKSFNEMCRDFKRLGEIVGKEKEAEDVIKEAERKIEIIRKKVSSLARPKVFMQIGSSPLYTVNRDSFLNDFIEMAGGENIAASSPSGIYSREIVIKQNPDIIIITTMGITGEEEKKKWERFRTLNASKTKRIYIIDSERFCSPTPVSFVEGLEEMAGIIHGK